MGRKKEKDDLKTISGKVKGKFVCEPNFPCIWTVLGRVVGSRFFLML
jgi:hypothetical protein